MRAKSSSIRLVLYSTIAFLLGILFSYAFQLRNGSPQPQAAGHGSIVRQLDQKGARKQGPRVTAKRKKLLAIVGVQTGFNRPGAPDSYNYKHRRDALRSTWFPASQAAADQLEKETDMLLRFVVGHSKDQQQENEMNQEIAKNGAFLRLPIVEAYLSLTMKTVVFLRQVTELFEAQYIVKVDDDVFLRLDHLQLAIAQWHRANADYVGCMKTGSIMRDPKLRWYEPQHALLGDQKYFTHAWGSVYVLSDHAASTLARVSEAVPDGLRFFNNEDVTIGSWMLAMNVTHLDDRRLCEEKCGPATVAVYDIPKCAGLCNAPQKLPVLHKMPACRTPPPDDLPTLEPYFWF